MGGCQFVANDRDAFFGGGIGVVGDDQPRRFSVRGHEELHPFLKVGVGEHFRGEVEVVVALGRVECLSHRGRGVGHLLHLFDESVEAAVDGLQGALHGGRCGDDRRELRDQLRNDSIHVIHAGDDAVHAADQGLHIAAK